MYEHLRESNLLIYPGGPKVKKKRTGLTAAIIIIVLALIGGGAYWYTSRTEFKLGRSGYSKEQIETIKSLFSEGE